MNMNSKNKDRESFHFPAEFEICIEVLRTFLSRDDGNINHFDYHLQFRSNASLSPRFHICDIIPKNVQS